MRAVGASSPMPRRLAVAGQQVLLGAWFPRFEDPFGSFLVQCLKYYFRAI